jgi:6-phosphofructokinase 1
MIAEGVVLDVADEDLAGLEEVERDAHGHLRIAEVNIGEILKAQVNARLKKFGIKMTTVVKNVGYELRCADPIPFDMEYTRDLGYCAAKYLRLVDIASTRYAIARRYMIRLRRDDFEDPHELAKLAATANVPLQDFRREFEYLIASEPPPLQVDERGETLLS